MTGKGLSAKYHFPRQPCLYQPSMVAVQVILTNSSDHSLEKIHIGDRSPASLHIHCFNTIGEYWCGMCKNTPLRTHQKETEVFHSLQLFLEATPPVCRIQTHNNELLGREGFTPSEAMFAG